MARPHHKSPASPPADASRRRPGQPSSGFVRGKWAFLAKDTECTHPWIGISLLTVRDLIGFARTLPNSAGRSVGNEALLMRSKQEELDWKPLYRQIPKPFRQGRTTPIKRAAKREHFLVRLTRRQPAHPRQTYPMGGLAGGRAGSTCPEQALADCGKSLTRLALAPIPPAFIGETTSYQPIGGHVTASPDKNGPRIQHRHPFFRSLPSPTSIVERAKDCRP